MKQHPLKVERMSRGWSQAKVAEALNTTVRTISRWEQGQSLPYPFYREQLSQLFGKSPRELGLLQEQAEEPPYAEKPVVSQSSIPASLSSMLVDPTVPEALGSASGLVGREQVIRQTKQHLFEEKGRIALYGLPGIGKTALAVALANDPQSQSQFPDGILWAGLGPQPDILEVLIRWGKLLGITPAEVENASSQEDWRRALQAAIGGWRLFVVIDDAWSITDAFALQIGGTRCSYLLTTRHPQIAFAFAREKAIAVCELDEGDSLTLLARFVPQLVRQEREEACFLVREVSGLPLALTLMGKYLAAHFLPSQPHRIRRALAQLHQVEQRLQIGSTSRSSSGLLHDLSLSLHAAIAVSDQRLSPPAHRALRALSVFPAKPDSFTEEAALAVSGELIGVLDELWDAGLLESNGPGRYYLHRTIVNYAQMHIEDDTAKLRLIRYVLAYVNEHQYHYEQLEREAPMFWVMLDIAGEMEMWSELVQGAIALVPFLFVRGLYSQADRLLQQALLATQLLEDQLVSTIILSHLANFTDLLGDYSRTETYGRRGLEQARTLGRQDLESGFLYQLGDIRRKHGDYTQAKSLFEEGLRLARTLGDLERICHLLNGLGTTLYCQGQTREASAYCAEALTLARQTGSQELVSRQLASLSAFEQEQGNYAQAEVYCQEGIRLAWQVGYQEQLCFHLNTLGLIAVGQGTYSQAEAYYQEALAQARRIGHRAHICTLLTSLGELNEMRGNYMLAERYLQEGVELARQMGLLHAEVSIATLEKLGHRSAREIRQWLTTF